MYNLDIWWFILKKIPFLSDKLELVLFEYSLSSKDSDSSEIRPLDWSSNLGSTNIYNSFMLNWMDI